MKKYEGRMKKYVGSSEFGNMKKYNENLKKYEGIWRYMIEI